MKRSWLYTLVAVLLLAAGVGAYSLGHILGTSRDNVELGGTAFQTPVDVTDVGLQKVEGKFQFSDLKGQVVVVFFGFTHCPDVCPLTMSRLAEIYRSIGEPKDLSVVLITLDPANDTSQIIEQYATAFHPSFIGLSGNNTEIATATQRFFIGFNKTDDGTVIHTDPVLILDREGKMQRVYSQTSMMQLQQDLPRLLETL